MPHSDMDFNYSRLVAQSRQLVTLRWYIICISAILLIAIDARVPLGKQTLDALVDMYLGVIGVNAGGGVFYKLMEKFPATRKTYYRLISIVITHMTIDLGFITLAVHLTGGLESPNSALFFLYLGVVATILSKRWLVLITALAMIFYSALMESYLHHIIEPIPLGEAMSILQAIPPARVRIQMAYVLVFMGMAAILLYRLAKELRDLSLKSMKQERFLSRLHNLTVASLPHDDLVDLYQVLADQIQAVLHCDGVYLTCYAAESRQGVPMAASGELRSSYPLLDPQPWKSTLIESLKTSGHSIVVEDVHDSPRISTDITELFPAKSFLALPMFQYGQENQFLGAVLVAYNQKHQFSSEEIDRAEQVVDTVALMLSQGHLHAYVQQRERLLHQLAVYDSEASRSLDADEIIPALTRSSMELLNAQRAALFVYEAKRELLSCKYAIHVSSHYIAWLNAHYRETPGAVVLMGEPLVMMPDIYQMPPENEVRQKLEEEGIAAFAVFALLSPHGAQGALVLYWDQPYELSQNEATVGQLFATRAGYALYNASLHALVEHQSVTDMLTGMPNRRAFDRRLDDEINRASRYEHTFALIMMDLDGFKAVNDRLGHPVGDLVLQQIVVCLKNALRKTDFVARFGGDEFSAILPRTNSKTAWQVAQKIREAVENYHFNVSEDSLPITISISQGIAIYPDHAKNAADLFALADKTLYRAKYPRKGSIACAGNPETG